MCFFQGFEQITNFIYLFLFLFFILICCLFFASIYSLLTIIVGINITTPSIIYIHILLFSPAFGNILCIRSFTPITFTLTPSFSFGITSFVLLPFAFTLFVTVLSSSCFVYSTSYLNLTSAPFGNTLILNLAFPKCLISKLLLSSSFTLLSTYLAFPSNISSISTSFASYLPIFLNVTIYVFFSPTLTSFFSTAFSISNSVSFTVEFNVFFVTIISSFVFIPFTFVTDVISSAFSISSYFTSYTRLYFSCFSILSSVNVTLSFSTFKSFTVFVTSSPLLFRTFTVSFNILPFCPIFSSTDIFLARYSPLFVILTLYVFLSTSLGFSFSTVFTISIFVSFILPSTFV